MRGVRDEGVMKESGTAGRFRKRTSHGPTHGRSVLAPHRRERRELPISLGFMKVLVKRAATLAIMIFVAI